MITHQSNMIETSNCVETKVMPMFEDRKVSQISTSNVSLNSNYISSIFDQKKLEEVGFIIFLLNKLG